MGLPHRSAGQAQLSAAVEPHELIFSLTNAGVAARCLHVAAELGVADTHLLGEDVTLPLAFACAVDGLAIPHEEALLAMVFAWVENRVLVCVKSVPLGQVAGQRLLLSLRPEIERAVELAQRLPDDELSNWAPGLSMLSMRHEVQHGRLYRS